VPRCGLARLYLPAPGPARSRPGAPRPGRRGPWPLPPPPGVGEGGSRRSAGRGGCAAAEGEGEGRRDEGEPRGGGGFTCATAMPAAAEALSRAEAGREGHGRGPQRAGGGESRPVAPQPCPSALRGQGTPPTGPRAWAPSPPPGRETRLRAPIPTEASVRKHVAGGGRSARPNPAEEEPPPVSARADSASAPHRYRGHRTEGTPSGIGSPAIRRLIWGRKRDEAASAAGFCTCVRSEWRRTNRGSAVSGRRRRQQRRG
jgi:hypothetical protein